MNKIFQMCNDMLYDFCIKTDIQPDLLFQLEQVEPFLFAFHGAIYFKSLSYWAQRTLS